MSHVSVLQHLKSEGHWRINPTMARPSRLSMGLHGPRSPQPQKKYGWADGHWAMYSTYHGKIHVGLLNLL